MAGTLLPHLACIGLGSNLGDSRRILRRAWQDIAAGEGIQAISLSPPFMSRPVDMASRHWFVNAAGLLRTGLAPGQLLELLHAVEDRHGRTRPSDRQGYQDRTLDLDLLIYDRVLSEDAALTLPHPRMAQRCFVLLPLAVVCGGLVHPLLGKDVARLCAELHCHDEADVAETTWSGQG